MSDQRIQYDEEMVGADHPTKSDTLNRLAMVEHASDGNHTVIGLDQQSAAPASATEHGMVYAKDASGITELFYLDSADNEIQITSGGDLMGSLDVQAVEVTIDSDGAQDWETKNVTITEVADPDNYSISFGRNAYANAIRNDVGGTGNFTIYDLRARLTSTTNLEVNYWDTLQTGASIFPIFITSKLA